MPTYKAHLAPLGSVPWDWDEGGNRTCRGRAQGFYSTQGVCPWPDDLRIMALSLPVRTKSLMWRLSLRRFSFPSGQRFSLYFYTDKFPSSISCFYSKERRVQRPLRSAFTVFYGLVLKGSFFPSRGWTETGFVAILFLLIINSRNQRLELSSSQFHRAGGRGHHSGGPEGPPLLTHRTRTKEDYSPTLKCNGICLVGFWTYLGPVTLFFLPFSPLGTGMLVSGLLRRRWLQWYVVTAGSWLKRNFTPG